MTLQQEKRLIYLKQKESTMNMILTKKLKSLRKKCLNQNDFYWKTDMKVYSGFMTLNHYNDKKSVFYTAYYVKGVKTVWKRTQLDFYCKGK